MLLLLPLAFNQATASHQIDSTRLDSPPLLQAPPRSPAGQGPGPYLTAAPTAVDHRVSETMQENARSCEAGEINLS